MAFGALSALYQNLQCLGCGAGKKRKSLIEIFLIIISSALLQAISSQRQYQPKFIPTLVPSAAEGVVEYNYIQLV